jgi:hypothetical protein
VWGPMKLRIRGSSLRLRLGQSEVDELAERGVVAEEIAFGAAPSERLAYVLACSAEATAVTARLEPAAIRVIVPTALARQWATSNEQVGIEGEQAIGEGRTLRILIEKDFACLAPRPEAGKRSC